MILNHKNNVAGFAGAHTVIGLPLMVTAQIVSITSTVTAPPPEQACLDVTVAEVTTCTVKIGTSRAFAWPDVSALHDQPMYSTGFFINNEQIPNDVRHWETGQQADYDWSGISFATDLTGGAAGAPQWTRDARAGCILLGPEGSTNYAFGAFHSKTAVGKEVLFLNRDGVEISRTVIASNRVQPFSDDVLMHTLSAPIGDAEKCKIYPLVSNIEAVAEGGVIICIEEDRRFTNRRIKAYTTGENINHENLYVDGELEPGDSGKPGMVAYEAPLTPGEFGELACLIAGHFGVSSSESPVWPFFLDEINSLMAANGHGPLSTVALPGRLDGAHLNVTAAPLTTCTVTLEEC